MPTNRPDKMKKKIVQFYGLETHAFTEDEEIPNEAFRVAFCNLSLTTKDGTPAKIPTTDFLYIGSIGSAYNSERMLQCGITHILCLSEVIRLNFPEKFTYMRVPMADQPDYNIADDLQGIFEFMDEVKSAGGKLLVHCYQGKSRSVTVCCAYLIKYHNHSLESALELVREVRPIAAPNSGFLTALQDFEEQCRGLSSGGEASTTECTADTV